LRQTVRHCAVYSLVAFGSGLVLGGVLGAVSRTVGHGPATAVTGAVSLVVANRAVLTARTRLLAAREAYSAAYTRLLALAQRQGLTPSNPTLHALGERIWVARGGRRLYQAAVAARNELHSADAAYARAAMRFLESRGGGAVASGTRSLWQSLVVPVVLGVGVDVSKYLYELSHASLPSSDCN
jgi:hypothetical protein